MTCPSPSIALWFGESMTDAPISITMTTTNAAPIQPLYRRATGENAVDSDLSSSPERLACLARPHAGQGGPAAASDERIERGAGGMDHLYVEECGRSGLVTPRTRQEHSAWPVTRASTSGRPGRQAACFGATDRLSEKTRLPCAAVPGSTPSKASSCRQLAAIGATTPVPHATKHPHGGGCGYGKSIWPRTTHRASDGYSLACMMGVVPAFLRLL